MYRPIQEERARREREARRSWIRVTPRDEEELDWYLASIVGLGA